MSRGDASFLPQFCPSDGSPGPQAGLPVFVPNPEVGLYA